MFFASIKYSFLFLLIPFIIIAIVYKFHRKKVMIRKFADTLTSCKLLEKVDYNKMKFKDIMLLLAIALIILSMMQPQFGLKKQIITKAGIDIVFTLDVSESMLAEDIKPDRLSKAKYEISQLVQKFKGDRVGLVIFSGTAFIQVPLTHDYAVFNMFLDNVTTESVELPGTNITDALSKSLELFNIKETTSKVVILLTDGEDTVEESVKIAEKGAQMNVKIYTVGVGSPNGARIPAIDDKGQRMGFKKDRQGNIITTKLDVKTLQKIALETKANSYIAGSGDMDLGKILEKISQDERKAIQSNHYGMYEDRFQWPLLFGLIMLCIATFLSETRIPSSVLKTLIISMIFFGLYSGQSSFALTQEAQVPEGKPEPLVRKQQIPAVSRLTGFIDDTYKRIIEGVKNYNNESYDKAYVEFNKLLLKDPENKELHLNTGSALYKSRKYDEAIKEFEDAMYSKNIDIKADAYYNIANSYFRQDKLDESLEFYKKSLELRPDDTDAKYNIEVIRKKIKENAEKQQQQQQQQQKQDQKDQQEQDQKDQQKQDQKDQQKQDQKDQQKQDQKDQQKQDQKDQQKQDQKDQQKQDKPEDKKMSEEEAEKLLKQIMDMEKEDLKNKKKEKMESQGRYHVDKDW